MPLSISKAQTESKRLARSITELLITYLKQYFHLLDTGQLEPRLSKSQVVNAKRVLACFVHSITTKSQKGLNLVELYPHAIESLVEPQEAEIDKELETQVEEMKRVLAQKQALLQDLRGELAQLIDEGLELEEYAIYQANGIQKVVTSSTSSSSSSSATATASPAATEVTYTSTQTNATPSTKSSQQQHPPTTPSFADRYKASLSYAYQMTPHQRKQYLDRLGHELALKPSSTTLPTAAQASAVTLLSLYSSTPQERERIGVALLSTLASGIVDRHKLIPIKVSKLSQAASRNDSALSNIARAIKLINQSNDNGSTSLGDD